LAGIVAAKLCSSAGTTASGLTTVQPSRTQAPGTLSAVQVAGIVAAKLCPSFGYVLFSSKAQPSRLHHRNPWPSASQVGGTASLPYSKSWATGLMGIAVVFLAPQTAQLLVSTPSATHVGALVTVHPPHVCAHGRGFELLSQAINTHPKSAVMARASHTLFLFFIENLLVLFLIVNSYLFMYSLGGFIPGNRQKEGFYASFFYIMRERERENLNSHRKTPATASLSWRLFRSLDYFSIVCRFLQPAF